MGVEGSVRNGMMRKALNPIAPTRIRAVREHWLAGLSDRSGNTGIARFPKRAANYTPSGRGSDKRTNSLDRIVPRVLTLAGRRGGFARPQDRLRHHGQVSLLSVLPPAAQEGLQPLAGFLRQDGDDLRQRVGA